MSWNINGVSNKLENVHVKQLLGEHDIICLNELKTPLNFAIPGYRFFRTKGENQHRGGCAVLVKNAIQLQQVIVCNEDCIHFKLCNFPLITFIACYIPPGDSPFSRDEAVSCIQEQVKKGEQIFLIGDLNARFGTVGNIVAEK